MGIETDLEIVRKLTACPFDHVCYLPKHHFICKIPECTTCPEYREKVRQLKSRILF